MNSKAMMLVVGRYIPPDKNGEGEIIEKDWFRQGWIFKDEDAFTNRPDDICYIPELSDTKYSGKDILQECGGSKEVAEEIFNELDWQHVESLLEERKAAGEIDDCKECGKTFFCHGMEMCPYCGAKYEEGES